MEHSISGMWSTSWTYRLYCTHQMGLRKTATSSTQIFHHLCVPDKSHIARMICWPFGPGEIVVFLSCQKHNLKYYNYRPQTKSVVRSCFYTCLSVILFTGGGGCYDVTSCYGQHHPVQHQPLDSIPPESTTPPLPLPGQHVSGQHHPFPFNRRVVRILLECFLV